MRARQGEEVEGQVGDDAEDPVCGECQDQPERGHDEARVPRIIHSPTKPTRREVEEHLPLHYPFRSWCKHCLRGKGMAGPHRRRNAEDREFSKGRVPTISMDHCFLGAEEEEDSASSNPFLVIQDADSEAIYCIPMRTKEAKRWVIVLVNAIIRELGYEGVKISIKCDGARELIAIRREITLMRNSPTVPITAPVRVSQSNGAIEGV